MKKEILWLEPVWKPMIWGSENWLVSAHPHGDCKIKEGSFAGRYLSALWREERELFGYAEGDVFPLLVKIIDAREDLSIQVHPDDYYAKKHEAGSLGKTECWYILDAPEKGSLIIGHNAKDRTELEQMTAENRWQELLREIPVKTGDMIQIEPGTLHAIKGGIKILETQENSDITYRIYDYGRVKDGKPRELHLQKGLEVIQIPSQPAQVTEMPAGIGVKNGEKTALISCDYYTIWKLEVSDTATFEQNSPFLLIYVLEGEGNIKGQASEEAAASTVSAVFDQRNHFRKEDCFILPSHYGQVSVTGKTTLILVSPGS